MCAHALSHNYMRSETITTIIKSILQRVYRRLGGKSRHVDFSLEKPTRRFSVEKADMSIFG